MCTQAVISRMRLLQSKPEALHVGDFGSLALILMLLKS